MYGDSLNALRKMLSISFPAVSKIYVSTMPDSFTRPSFFIGIVTANEDHLNREMYESNVTWQIVYFAPLLSTKAVDVFNQLDVSSELKKIFMEAMILKGANTIYHILDIEGGPREEEVYMTVRLSVEYTRPRELFEEMQKIHLKQKEE